MFDRFSKAFLRKDKGSDSESENRLRDREYDPGNQPNSPEREAGGKTSPIKMDSNSRLEIENDANDKRKPVVEVYTSMSPYISCAMYTFFSVSMVLSNKAISTSLDQSIRAKMPQMSVILYQNIIAVILVETAKYFKYIDYPNFSRETAQSWLPMNALFVAMLCSGFLALCYISVPMVQTLKNVANLFTVAGDWYFFGEIVSTLSLSAIFIMCIGAAFASANDLEFSWIGYFWMLVNCLCTASYTLYMRYASRNIKLPRMGMIYYNNLLSTIFLIPMILFMNEISALMDPEIMTTQFFIVNTVAGTLGAGLNFSSLYCVGATSATTYAIVGTLNKIPVTIIGYFLFDAKITNNGLIFIALASLGGILYGYTKLPKPKSEILPSSGKK